MKLYSEDKQYKLYLGNMLDLLQVIEPNSIDSIVTDPPYELNFMNKGWDNAGVSFQANTWKQCYKALKPGGYLLAFGGSRTYHRIACAIEDAGFEIRDTIMWLYGSGFPKSMNIGLAIDKKNGVDNRTGEIRTNGNKCGGVQTFDDDNYIWKDEFEVREAQNEWKGWGTALKPAFEPIIVARKPFKGSCVDNVIKWGVGGINIDECRIEHNEDLKLTVRQPKSGEVFNTETSGYDNTNNHIASADIKGRFPANVILTYDDTDYEEVCGGMPNTKGGGKTKEKGSYGFCFEENRDSKPMADGYSDEGSTCRYFYCAKASKKDRDEGLSKFETKQCVGGGGGIDDYLNDVNSCSDKSDSEKAPHKNIHPTVKPCNLMRYLIRLVTPNGGTVLDPFNGSGSTGKAVMYENLEKDKGYKYIGIELSEEYLSISEARIEYVINKINSENKQITFDV